MGILVYMLVIILYIIIHSDVANRKKYFRHIEKYIHPKDTILDFGGGNCKFAEYMQNRNKVTTVDIFKGCSTSDVYDGFKLPYEDNSFDVVVCMFVLHHIPHQSKIIKEIMRVCKKRLIILEDDPSSFFDILISKLHFIFFNQSMNCIKLMHSPVEWCKMIDCNSFEKLSVRSIINPTPHYIIIKDID